ncbi:ORF6C domain-containing protein [Salinicoccus sp. ID82-1]|uniref:BRO family protein n=1 Tax=Salinicoccus sp. ID82-1 TaxID=2820269 RepID=UPI001F48A2D9|nr:BRO family protein [Salinicoccus sp. ID82-1]MCG1009259.1 ORF6C domain-containing protein [Salinicoccus sp. ID82-1]
MEELQIFSFEDNDVRTTVINDQPYFVASDVCAVLEIKNSRDAVSRLEDDEKATSVVPTHYGDKLMHVINESGLYALIFSSRKEEARKFRKWVTSEVLPQIRQTGKYEAPKDPMEIMRLQFEAMDQTNKKVATIEKDVTYLKDEVKLEAGEYGYINRHVAKTVMETIRAFAYANTKSVKAALFKDINRGINEVAGVKTRTQLRQKHFNLVIDFINEWVPSTATRLKVQQLSLEFADDQVDGQANV